MTLSDRVKYLRSFRLFNIAMFDVIASIVFMILIISFAYKKMSGDPHIYRSVILGTLSAIPIGIAAHYAFGIPTELNYKLGISGKPKRD